MEKIKVKVGKNLGDQLLYFSKLQNIFSLKEMQEQVKIYYYNPLFGEKSLETVKDFWRIQGVEIEHVDPPYEKDKNQYTYYFGNPRCQPVHETHFIYTKPYPELIFDKQENYDIIIQLVGGIGLDRIISYNQVKDFIFKHKEKNIKIIGLAPKGLEDKINNKFAPVSLLNKTTFKEYMNICCSCNTYIGTIGFGYFLAATQRKKCFIVPAPINTVKYRTEQELQPNEWKQISQRINDLKEIIL